MVPIGMGRGKAERTWVQGVQVVQGMASCGGHAHNVLSSLQVVAVMAAQVL